MYVGLCTALALQRQILPWLSQPSTYSYTSSTHANRYIYPFPCIGGDWLLLAGRVCPFLVIIFMDTALFYQITTTIFGILRWDWEAGRCVEEELNKMERAGLLQ